MSTPSPGRPGGRGGLGDTGSAGPAVLDQPWLRRSWRGVWAVAVTVALLVDVLPRLGDPAFDLVTYASYFTIETNVLAAVVLAVGALRDPTGRRWAMLRGLLTLAAVVTGVVFALLLRDVPVGLSTPWINTVLHQLIPVAVLVDWLAFPPRHRIRPVAALGWLAFPLVYLTYTLLRGPVVDFYPYPFLDPRPDGYLPVALTAVVLGVAMAALALALAWSGAAVRSRRRPGRTP